MRHRRGATDLAGVLLVDKPRGWTSHDVVARLRSLSGEGRIGHAGTLDPDATGLLLILFGPATRLSDALRGAQKTYRATISFGAQTSTDDGSGDILATAPVPAEFFEAAFAEKTLEGFCGSQLQVPPQFSAIKQQGTPAYRHARAGRQLELKPRAIEVFEAQLIEADAVTATWTVDFTVSKGTYIRALGRDIGLALGSRAHLSALRRTAVGVLNLSEAQSIETLARACADDPLAVADFFLRRDALAAALPEGAVLPVAVAGPRIGPAVVALGTFDGVHAGHRALLHSAAADAHSRGLPAVAVTFDPLPAAVLRPAKASHELSTLKQRIAALYACGIDEVIVFAFTPAFAQRSSREFLTEILPTRVIAAVIEVGENFCFGRGAETSVAAGMDALASELGIELIVHPLLRDEHGLVYSSTRLREEKFNTL